MDKMGDGLQAKSSEPVDAGLKEAVHSMKAEVASFTYGEEEVMGACESGHPEARTLVLGGGDPRDDALAEEALDESVAWKGRIFNVDRLTVRLPDGREAVRDVVRHPGAVAIIDLLGRMNVADPARILGSYPFELSGGLGQRVGIAMAMLMRPKLLFADEPTSALDVVSQKQVVGELARVRSELGCAIVVVTHNIAVVRMLADDVLVLRGGHVVEQGPADQLLSHPRQPYTVELLDAAPRLHKESCP